MALSPYKSLRIKISIISIAVLTLALVLNTFISTRFLINESTRALESETETIGTMLRMQLERLLELGLSIDEIIGFDAQCREVVEKYDIISTAMVVRPDSRVLFSADPTLKGTALDCKALLAAIEGQRTIIETCDFNGTLHHFATIPTLNEHGVAVCVTRVGFPESILQRNKDTLLWTSVQILPLPLLLAAILTLVFLSRWVIKPLDRLLSVILNIRHDERDLTARVDVRSDDEIGALATAFNDMLSSLEEKDRSLDQYRQKLEDKIEALAASREALQDHRIELEELVEERTQDLAELKLAQAQLVQAAKLASIGELAAGTAHELNQPLMILRTLVQYLQRNTGKGAVSREEIIESYDKMLEATRRMVKIIDHLRTFSRQSDNTFSAVNINDVVNNCLLMVKEQLHLKAIAVDLDLAANLPEISADPLQLEQVFLNLINNARDAIEDRFGSAGGAGAAVPAKKKRLAIITEPAPHTADAVQLLIRDSGSGMGSDTLASIFDPFFTTKDVGKGTGLGLSISYGIIQNHQGSIDIVSTGPEGTTFRVLLPVKQQPKQERQ